MYPDLTKQRFYPILVALTFLFGHYLGHYPFWSLAQMVQGLAPHHSLASGAGMFNRRTMFDNPRGTMPKRRQLRKNVEHDKCQYTSQQSEDCLRESVRRPILCSDPRLIPKVHPSPDSG